MTTDFLIGAIRASRDLHPQVKTELEEILHQAEPRLLTVEEINGMKAGTPLVVERKIEHNGRIVPLACWGINSGSLILSFHGTMFPDTVHEIPYKTISTNESTGKIETHLFRFWNTMPERDQMCGTPWEKEGEHDANGQGQVSGELETDCLCEEGERELALRGLRNAVPEAGGSVRHA